MNQRYTLRVKDLPQAQRPRERLLLSGPRTLSNSDLLALILRMGNGKESAMALAQRILTEVGGLTKLAAMNTAELVRQFDGVGPAKAAEINAVFELGRRTAAESIPDSVRIDTSQIAFDILKPKLQHLDQEEFWIILVNSRGRYMREINITRGSANATVIEPMEVFRPAISFAAAAIILAHNHPNGDLNPSNEDILLTQRLFDAGETIGIQVLDHIIITDHDFTSFTDIGLMPMKLD